MKISPQHSLSVILFFVSSFLFHPAAYFLLTIDRSSSVSVDIAGTPFDGVSDDIAIVGYYNFSAGFQIAAGRRLDLKILAPVSNTIDLNGTGVLGLSGDLSLDTSARIQGSGTIDGQGCTINITNDLSYNGTSDVLTFSSGVIIDGHNSTITLGGGSSFVLANDASLTLKNMTLIITGSATSPFSGAGLVMLDNVRLVLMRNVVIPDPVYLSFRNSVVVSASGVYALTFSSSSDFTLSANTQLKICKGVTLKHNYASANNMYFTDKTSCLYLAGGTFESAARTLTLTTGSFKVGQRSYIKGSGASGNVVLGSSGDPLSIILKSGATLEACGNTVSYGNPN